MKTLNDYITEEPSFRKKGWANIKSGKIVLWNFRGRSIRPYHTEYVTNNPKEFFPGGEEELLRKFADVNGFEPDDIETQSMWSDLVKGKVDRDSNLDGIMNFAGWFRVVFDEGLCSIETQTTAEGRKVAKIIDKNIPWKRIESLYVYDKGHFDSATELHSEGDLQSYIKTGRVPKRTEIGSTLAMFREFAGDKDSFRAHWKKAPIMKTGATDVKKRNAHWDAYFKHFEDKYGEIPNRIKNAMRMSDYKTNPSVTYKGRKFKLRTGMDEMDLLYHVLSEGKRIPKTRKNQDPDTHSDLYTDEDPKGTIHGLGFKDVKTAKASIVKIKKSGRTHAHKIQAAIAMEQRAKVMGKRAEAKVYRDFIEMMKKKTKEMNKEDWSDKYKKSIDCNNPKGFSQKAHCDGRAKRARGETTESEPVTEKTYAKSGLGKWFNQQSAGGGPGWDRYGTNGQKLGKCGDAKEGEPYSACLSRQKAQKLGKKKIASFVRRKRAAQDKAGRGDVGDGGKGKKPINVKTGVTDKDPKKKGIQDSFSKFLEGSKPGVKRGPYKNTDNVVNKMSKDEIGKSSDSVLNSILKKGGVNVGAIKSELKSRGSKVAQKGKETLTKADSVVNKIIDKYKSEPVQDNGLTKRQEEIIMSLANKGESPIAKLKQAVIEKIAKIAHESDDRMNERMKEAKKRADEKAEKEGKKVVHSTDIEKEYRQLEKEYYGEKIKKATGGVIDLEKLDKKVVGLKKRLTKEEDMKSFKTYISEKNVPDNPELWKRAIAKAKAKFDVYPSAYANAWASKWYKGEGGTWSVKKEEVENCDCGCDEIIETVIIYEEDGNKKKVKLNDPFRTPGGPKKFGVYVKNEKGNVVLVRFGDPNLSIKRDDPERLKSFRARHGCDKDPGPKWKAKYWSCKFWEKDKPVSGLLKKGKVS